MSLFVLIISLIFMKATGEINLEVSKHQNGSKTPVLTVVEVYNGSNFTLECTIVDKVTKSNLKFDDVIWGKIERSNDRHLKALLESKIVTSNFTITGVRFEDQGEYFCASPKQKLIKTVYLIIKFGQNRSRLRRANDVESTTNDGGIVVTREEHNFTIWLILAYVILVTTLCILTKCCTRGPCKRRSSQSGTTIYHQPTYFPTHSHHHFTTTHNVHHIVPLATDWDNTNDGFSNRILNSHEDAGAVGSVDHTVDGFSSRILLDDNTDSGGCATATYDSTTYDCGGGGDNSTYD